MDNLITDRTQADVNELKRLAAIGWANMTAEERQAWLNDSKGAYNASDANRVGHAVDYVADTLNSVQGAINAELELRGVAPDELFNPTWDDIAVTPKTDWAQGDIPTPTQAQKYLADATEVVSALDVPAELPVSMDGLTVDGANDIERALLQEYNAAVAFEERKKHLIDNTARAFVYSGQIYCGQIWTQTVDVPIPATLVGIAITTQPTKTSYAVGEVFDPAGMVVTATYDDGTSAPVTGYTFEPSTALAATDTHVTISYAEGGVTATAEQPVTVSAFDDDFASNSWEEIISACQSGSVPATWLVGDHKNMTIGGTEYRIDIIGKNHDTYSDGSGTAPLTLQMHDCYGTEYPMNATKINSPGWRDSLLRTLYLPPILDTMPAAVRSAVREVDKLSWAGYGSAVIETTADKLFLLSEVEVFGETYYSASGEGYQYAYYADGNPRIKTRQGNAAGWWERSGRTGENRAYCYVNRYGDYSSIVASSSSGVAFAFCF